MADEAQVLDQESTEPVDHAASAPPELVSRFSPEPPSAAGETPVADSQPASGDETPQPSPQAGPPSESVPEATRPEWLTPDLEARATQLGVDPEYAAGHPDADALGRTLDQLTQFAMQRMPQQQPPAPPQPAFQPPGGPGAGYPGQQAPQPYPQFQQPPPVQTPQGQQLPQLPFQPYEFQLTPELQDDPVAQTAAQMAQHFNQQLAAVHQHHQQQMDAIASRENEARAQREIAEFDGQVATVESPELKAILSVGDSLKLSPHSPQFQARVQLETNQMRLRQAFPQLQGPTLFAEALRMTFPEAVNNHALAQQANGTTARIKKQNGQFIAPSGTPKNGDSVTGDSEFDAWLAEDPQRAEQARKQAERMGIPLA